MEKDFPRRIVTAAVRAVIEAYLPLWHTKILLISERFGRSMLGRLHPPKPPSHAGAVIAGHAIGVFQWAVGIIFGADLGPCVPEMAGQALCQQRAVARFQRLDDRFMLVYGFMPQCVSLVGTVPDAIYPGVELVVCFDQHRIAAGGDDALVDLLIEFEIG